MQPRASPVTGRNVVYEKPIMIEMEVLHKIKKNFRRFVFF